MRCQDFGLTLPVGHDCGSDLRSLSISRVRSPLYGYGLEGELGGCGPRQIRSDTRMRDVMTAALTLDISLSISSALASLSR